MEPDEGEADRPRAVGFSGDDDPPVALHRDRGGQVGRAEVDGGVAPAGEGRVEISGRRIAEDAEVPVRSAVLDLADDDELPVGLDRYVSRPARQVERRSDLERAHPAVAREARIEPAAGGQRESDLAGRQQRDHSGPDDGCAHQTPHSHLGTA